MTLVCDWHVKWHQVIERELGPDPDGCASDELFGFDDDFRMHFDSWSLPADAIRECFSLLPCGDIMAERALNRFPAPHNENDAIAILAQGIVDLNFHIEQDSGARKNSLRVFRGDQKAMNTIFHSADTPTIALDDRLPGMAKRHSGTEGKEAFFFVRETLYRLASSYAIANWISWPLCYDFHKSDPYKNFARLAESNVFFPGLDEQGVFLFIRE